MSRLLRSRFIPVSQVHRYWDNLRKLGPNTRNHVRDIWKVIQSLQLLLFHQIKFYSRVIALCGLSYTCFIGNQLLLQFGETGLKTRKTCAQESWKVIQSLQHLASHQMRPYSSVISLCGLSCTCFPGFTVLGQFRETAPEYPLSCAGSREK